MKTKEEQIVLEFENDEKQAEQQNEQGHREQPARRDEHFSYKIEAHLGVLSYAKNGWKRELNLVSWNQRPKRLDLRDWAPNHGRMGRGISLDAVETDNLIALLQDQSAHRLNL